MIAGGNSQNSIPARWTAIDANGVEVNWDIRATPFTLEILKNGTSAILISGNSIYIGGVVHS